jgi:hypothetical protein
MENEKVFLEKSDLKVTNTRFVVSGKTYALASIASFRRHASEIQQTSKGMWLILGILALILLALPSLSAFAVGSSGLGVLLLLFGGGGAYICFKNFKNYKRKYLHKIVLSVASGEVAAYETLDGQLAAEIESSLTNAVVHRG